MLRNAQHMQLDHMLSEHVDVSVGSVMLSQDINGAFQPGVLTALVGVSGAGKTTLMDCLAGACVQACTPHVNPRALAQHWLL